MTTTTLAPLWTPANPDYPNVGRLIADRFGCRVCGKTWPVPVSGEPEVLDLVKHLHPTHYRYDQERP